MQEYPPKFKAKLITSAMFVGAWQDELNKFLSNERIHVIDIKFGIAALNEPIGNDMAIYSALILYEEKE